MFGPAGAGESAIYEIGEALRDGPTVVVSPLIVRQRDQVEALRGTRIGGAAQVDSTMAGRQRAEALGAMGWGTSGWGTGPSRWPWWRRTGCFG